MLTTAAVIVALLLAAVVALAIVVAALAVAAAAATAAGIMIWRAWPRSRRPLMVPDANGKMVPYDPETALAEWRAKWKPSARASMQAAVASPRTSGAARAPRAGLNVQLTS